MELKNYALMTSGRYSLGYTASVAALALATMVPSARIRKARNKANPPVCPQKDLRERIAKQAINDCFYSSQIPIEKPITPFAQIAIDQAAAKRQRRRERNLNLAQRAK